MGRRRTAGQSEHDAVVLASARTYADWKNKGFVVSVNPDGQKNQSIGSDQKPRYPDVLVWRPNTPGASSGRAHIIEEIETDDSVTEEEAGQWADYGSLGVETFSLVVPVELRDDALEIIRRRGISGITRVQGYWVRNGRIEFQL